MLTNSVSFVRIVAWPLSITVSTPGFHPGNAGSIPAEVTTYFFDFVNKPIGYFCLAQLLPYELLLDTTPIKGFPVSKTPLSAINITYLALLIVNRRSTDKILSFPSQAIQAHIKPT